jgi:hypothetical protein
VKFKWQTFQEKFFTQMHKLKKPVATISYACKFAYAGGLSVTKYFSYVVGHNCGVTTSLEVGLFSFQNATEYVRISSKSLLIE